MTSPSHILVVDDDDRLRNLLKQFLNDHDYAVSTAASAAEAREALRVFSYDAMILDIMMPGESGIELAQNMPVRNLPTLILSARSEAEDRIEGLEAGVDDYLTKPFEPKELLLRLQALLRRARTAPPKAQRCRFGAYEYDPDINQLLHAGKVISLTSGEAALLRALATYPGQAVPREELARLAGLGNVRSVDVQITRLRKKIESSETRPLYIQTIRGEGYGLFCT